MLSRLRNTVRRWQAVALVVALVALAVGLYAVHHRQRYRHFAVHDPGRVYRSAWVEADVFGELVRKYRVKTVVNLCFPGEMGDRNVAQRRAVEAAGARLVELPFPPNNTWNLEYEAIARFEQLIDDEANYPIWIHCQHGRERTVKALAIYDIRRRGMTAEASLASMPLFDMDHPWPIVVFAFNYETKTRGPAAAVAACDECQPPPQTARRP